MAYKYIQYKRNGKRIDAHRLLMQEHLGRTLQRNEYVHHINGDSKDNRLENLQVIDPVSHGRLHHLKHPLEKTCCVCGTVFSPHKTKRKRAQACGSVCGQVLARRKGGINAKYR